MQRDSDGSVTSPPPSPTALKAGGGRAAHLARKAERAERRAIRAARREQRSREQARREQRSALATAPASPSASAGGSGSGNISASASTAYLDRDEEDDSLDGVMHEADVWAAFLGAAVPRGAPPTHEATLTVTRIARTGHAVLDFATPIVLHLLLAPPRVAHVSLRDVVAAVVDDAEDDVLVRTPAHADELDDGEVYNVVDAHTAALAAAGVRVVLPQDLRRVLVTALELRPEAGLAGGAAVLDGHGHLRLDGDPRALRYTGTLTVAPIAQSRTVRRRGTGVVVPRVATLATVDVDEAAGQAVASPQATTVAAPAAQNAPNAPSAPRTAGGAAAAAAEAARDAATNANDVTRLVAWIAGAVIVGGGALMLVRRALDARRTRQELQPPAAPPSQPLAAASPQAPGVVPGGALPTGASAAGGGALASYALAASAAAAAAAAAAGGAVVAAPPSFRAPFAPMPLPMPAAAPHVALPAGPTPGAAMPVRAPAPAAGHLARLPVRAAGLLPRRAAHRPQ